MEQPNIALPENLQHYVDERVAADGFADPADFVRDLVERDRAAYEEDVKRVRALIDEGRASGLVDAEPEDILDEIISDIHRQHG